MLVDTHSHLFLEEFDVDRDEVIEAAKTAGIHKIVLPNVDSSTIESLGEMVKQYPDTCYPAYGLHPGSVKKNFKEELQIVKDCLQNKNPIAIGEIGIDLYWDKTFRKEQEEAFKTQVDWALEKNLPILVHNREAFDIVMDCLLAFDIKSWKGIFHCFTGTAEQATKVVDMGFLLGIGGVVTFKNAGLDNVVKHTGVGHLVLETDSPYLAPVPKRGKRNESAYLVYIAEKIAEITETKLDDVSNITSYNALKLFGLK